MGDPGIINRSLAAGRSMNPQTVFESMRLGLIGMPLSLLWRGYGSAIFLEFGKLTPNGSVAAVPTDIQSENSALESSGAGESRIACRLSAVVRVMKVGGSKHLISFEILDWLYSNCIHACPNLISRFQTSTICCHSTLAMASLTGSSSIDAHKNTLHSWSTTAA